MHASTEAALLATKPVIDPAGAILARGRELRESRGVCNVLWFSDADAGRIISSATIAGPLAEPEFATALNSAEPEGAAVRAENAQSVADVCAAEVPSLRVAPAALQ
jgi:acid phosphatase (class A)